MPWHIVAETLRRVAVVLVPVLAGLAGGTLAPDVVRCGETLRQLLGW